LTPSTRSDERLPLLTRCLVARVRLMSVSAQVAAGGPARPEQLARAVEPLLDQVLLQRSPKPALTIAARPRPRGRVAGRSNCLRCCCSEKEKKEERKKDPHTDKMEESRLLQEQFEKKKTVALLRKTLAENAARWKVKMEKKRSRARRKRKEA